MGITFLLFAATATIFQAPGRTSKEPDALVALVSAREQYESQVERRHADALALIREGTQVVKERLAIEQTFVESGELPSGPPFDELQRELDALVVELLRAYELAADQQLRADGGRAIATELVSEQELWSRVTEWAAWRNALVSFEPVPASEAVSRSTIPFELVDSARIEVSGTLSAPGTVRLQIPTGEGTAVEVELVAKANHFRCILTRASPSQYSLDLGFDRRRPAVPVEAALGKRMQLLDPSRRVTHLSVRWKPITFGEARELPARDATPATAPIGPEAAGADAVPGWPVGTKIVGIRTRSNGNPKQQLGEVLSNDGDELVVRMEDFHVWDYVFERTGGNKYRLASQVKKDPKSSNVVPRTSSFQIEDGCMTGSYRWVVNDKDDVNGTFEFYAFGTFAKAKAARGARRNPLDGHEAWTSGSTVTGLRSDGELGGVVLSCDGKRLRVILRETFYVEGRKNTPNFVYEFERTTDGRQGEIRYRLVDQLSLEDGPVPGHRFHFDGELTLKGDMLEGQIRFKNFPDAPRKHDNTFSLRVTKTATR